MSEGQNERRIGRRDFFKTVIGGAAALGLSGAFPGVPSTVRPARAAGQPGNFNGCKIVVFGADGLRVDYAQTLAAEGAPALSYLKAINPIICSMANGLSVTQPGWATIWTGMPSYFTKVFNNLEYETMRSHMHIMRKLRQGYKDEDFFIGWVSGKGRNCAGNKRLMNKDTPEERWEKGPHWQVKQDIVGYGHLGAYHGDESRGNSKVFQLGNDTLMEAITHQNFCCFVLFQDPDFTGHMTKDYYSYMDKALIVDDYISQLMDLLPPDTYVIYCSDHGFDFKHMGDTHNSHRYSPCGMLATNFPTNNYSVVDMCSVGRLIYRLAGGNPDSTKYMEWDPQVTLTHSMYGIDLV